MVELITLETEDACLLDAIYWPAAPDANAGAMRADACIFTHGATANAFSGVPQAMGKALSGAGVATISVNTRGHDIVSNVQRRGTTPARGGTAFEDLDEAAFDLHAAAAYLRSRGASRIAVAGHSLGAVKSIYVQATLPVEGAVAVIAVSPPRIAWEVQSVGPMARKFAATREKVLELIAAGKGDELVSTTVPIPGRFGATQFEKKYGQESRYDVVRHLDGLTVPIFFLFGTAEIEAHQLGASATATRAWTEAHPETATFAMIDGADHSYTGLRDEATAAVLGWLQG